MNDYQHTQRAPLWLMLLAIAGGMVYFGLLVVPETTAGYIMVGVSAIIVFFALCFAHETVEDEGDGLLVRYGPISLFRKRILYSAIRSARREKSKLIDGWGIHFLPGRGWTYNLWGFDCVELDVGRQSVRVGTDDAERLLEFVKGKIE